MDKAIVLPLFRGALMRHNTTADPGFPIVSPEMQKNIARNRQMDRLTGKVRYLIEADV